MNVQDISYEGITSLEVSLLDAEENNSVISVSPDSATAVGETYSQTEVQAILDELRDLKTKMRTAGILAT